MIRQSVDELTVQSRLATGVLIQKIAKDDKIIMVDIVPPLPPIDGGTDRSEGFTTPLMSPKAYSTAALL